MLDDALFEYPISTENLRRSIDAARRSQIAYELLGGSDIAQALACECLAWRERYGTEDPRNAGSPAPEGLKGKVING
jgi:hypothetical protein